MGELYNLIQEFKNGNTDTFVFILEKFEPKLNKLQRNSVYEDMKSDLILFMFKLLKTMPIERSVFNEEKYIISYIIKSLHHRYIYLNKTKFQVNIKEISLEERYVNTGDDSCFSKIMFEDLVKNLTETEKDTVSKKYLLNYSDDEIGKMKGISRQAVHKTHVRALSKMKKLLM